MVWFTLRALLLKREGGNIAAVERAHYFALVLQGRIAIPAAFLIAIPASAVQDAKLMPDWLRNVGMAVGGIVVAVGYALIYQHDGYSLVWPFFAISFFALAAISQWLYDLPLVVIGVALAFIYLNLSKQGGNGGGGRN